MYKLHVYIYRHIYTLRVYYIEMRLEIQLEDLAPRPVWRSQILGPEVAEAPGSVAVHATSGGPAWGGGRSVG